MKMDPVLSSGTRLYPSKSLILLSVLLQFTSTTNIKIGHTTSVHTELAAINPAKMIEQ